jgi:endonuclease/exonuclease/phosphatase family metal-dependent hydrolase
MRVFVLGLIFVFLAFSQGLSQDSLSILSWNIQMLPRGVNSNGKAKRARAIVDQLKKSSYDVVVFQELFYRRSRTILRKELQQAFPFQTPVLNKKAIALKTNGGVMIFSKHPIKEWKQIRYKKRSGPDRLSRKGAMLAELDIRGKSVQIIGTHLQAFGLKETMYSQYQQLHDELLAPNTKDKVPQLLCGDFNTLKEIPPHLPSDLSVNFEKRIAQYPAMLQTLKVEDGNLFGEHQYTMDRPHNDLCKKRKQYRLLLDYFLVKQNQSNILVKKREVQIMKYQWHKNHHDLSDHYGLAAVVSGF